MRDLTIRQRRRQWKGHRKIDLASVQTFSPSCQVTQLLESRESSFVTEERGPRPTSGRDGSIYRLDGVFLNSTTCVGKAKKCTKMRNARAKLLFCKCKPNSLLSHLRSHPTRFFFFFFFLTLRQLIIFVSWSCSSCLVGFSDFSLIDQECQNCLQIILSWLWGWFREK